MRLKMNRIVTLILLLGTINLTAQTVKTTWLGNTFGYGDGKWVQNHINSFYVMPDGTCYTQSIWDEGHHERGIYKDSDMKGNVTSIAGGLAVTGDGTDVIIADGLYKSYTIKRLLKGTNSVVWTITISDSTKVYDMATKNGKLYVSDPNYNRILIYNISDKSAVDTFAVTRPSELAVDNAGNIWVVQSPYSLHGSPPFPNPIIAPAKILCFSPIGEKLSPEITDVVDPSDLIVDKNGRLLVTENGPDLQVRCYKNLDSSPILDNTFFNNGTFGQKGGVYAGIRGQNADDKFYKLAGIGLDADGNIYLNMGGPTPKGDGPLMDVDLRKYNPAGVLQWKLLGKEFVDMGDLDPADDTKFHTKDSRYGLDWSKTTPGSEWSFDAVNIDPYRYPQDPRTKMVGATGPTQSIENIFMRRINGQLFMFGNSMAGDQGVHWVFRYKATTDGEIAIPCAAFGYYNVDSNTGNPVSWNIPNAPISNTRYEYIWRDLDADGQIETNEFEKNTNTEYLYCDGAWPDENGNYWRAYRDHGIRKLACSGVDANGVPLYSYAQRTYFDMPTPMTDVHFVRYFPSTDEMYLAGWTINNNVGNDTPSGIHTIVKYSNWSTTRTMVWESPAITKTDLNQANSFDIAGDFIFAVYAGRDGDTTPPYNGTVWVYKRSDGTAVTSFSPGVEVGKACGWVDIWDGGIRAHKRSNGEYLIFIEDDAHNKTIIFRWDGLVPNYPVTSVSLNQSAATISSNVPFVLKATILPDVATNKKVTWTSSNPLVATVNDTGLITAKIAGTSTITVTTDDGAKKATCAIKVDPFKLTGKIIGTPGSFNNDNTIAKVFDENLSTYFDPPGNTTPADQFVGLDFGSPKTITQIKFAPRPNVDGISRMLNGVFQVSNDSNFVTGVVTIYTILSTPPKNVLTTVNVTTTQDYRYIRYKSDGTNWCNIAEIEVRTFDPTNSISLPSQNATEIYPNPYTKGVLTIKLPNEANSIIRIFDVTGKVVYQTNQTALLIQINNLELANGIYFMNIQQNS